MMFDLIHSFYFLKHKYCNAFSIWIKIYQKCPKHRENNTPQAGQTSNTLQIRTLFL